MRLTRRQMIATGLAAGGLSQAGPGAWARADDPRLGAGLRSHGHSLIGDPKYPADFSHFEYVNPDAPKGGTARYSTSGGYDHFNAFVSKGRPTNLVTVTYDTLMTSSLDEGSTHYGLLAEWMEEATDYSWVAFKIRDAARWHDGAKVVPEDFIVTLDFLQTKAEPFYQFYFKDISSVRDVGDGVVLFELSTKDNRELPHIIGQIQPLAAHYWAGRDMAEPVTEPPLGCGAYKISSYEIARYVELRRVEDYWGADLPVNRGANNFDVLRIDYFLDRNVEFEAFKGGKSDYWNENSATRWAQKYDFPAAARGDVIKKEPVLDGPKSVQYLGFNLRREKFQDRRVREAISLAFDFEFSNRVIYFNQYARPSSFFQGSPDLMASELPSAEELALLEPYRDQLPAELFEKPFENPTTSGDGNNRRNLRRAKRLLSEAGYEVVDRVLREPDGKPFELEFLSASADQLKVIGPFLKNLSDFLGFQTNFRQVDFGQYVERLRSFNFDMAILGLANSQSPGNEQRDYWGSANADLPGARNRVGLKSPIVDDLIQRIVTAPDRAALQVASRALDRVLLWERVGVLQLYTPFERIAYWKTLASPDPLPARSVGFPTVWWSTDV